MIRPNLLHPRGERRPSRRQRDRTAPHPPLPASPAPAVEPMHACDLAVQRVREAGGPIDRAAYTCACGYMFSAAVSTTVSCPHCGAGQAW